MCNGNNNRKGISVSANFSQSDPNYKHELKKYAKPIASRQYVMDMLEANKGATTEKKLFKLLGLKPNLFPIMKRRLNAMVRSGQLIQTKKGYRLVKNQRLVEGLVTGHKDGFGFLITEDLDQDVFLPPRLMKKIFPGDKVSVSVTEKLGKNKYEAKTLDVIEHNTSRVFGKLCNKKGMNFVSVQGLPCTQQVLIDRKEEKNLPKIGSFVLVDIIKQPTEHYRAIGNVVKTYGLKMGYSLAIEMAINSHQLPVKWSRAVIESVKKMPTSVSKASNGSRRDLTELPFVTIDGQDAKDFDDAVYCETSPHGGWTLYVAIADVSHYVESGSALDLEAKERGNSVYFPEKVIPMLPEGLSNELCSLRPKRNRLVLVCELKINAAGLPTGSEFYSAVIHSHARLTYSQVSEFLVEKKSEQQDDWTLSVLRLEALYQRLLQQRQLRGALDFESREIIVVLDEGQKVSQLLRAERTIAHRIIEECMLAANVAAAQLLSQHKIATLYRVHDKPDQAKLKELRDYLTMFGLQLGGGDSSSSLDFSKLLSTVSSREDAHIIQTKVLRTLKQAVYHPSNEGHFGLAFEQYAHFTSPIRRYADLLVHRQIKACIDSHIDTPQLNEQALHQLGEHVSVTERRADLAARDVMDWLKCSFVSDHIGEVFKGKIVNVTGFGFFVELLDLLVEGLVSLTQLKDDYYEYDQMHMRLLGQRTKKTYSVGDSVTVLVAGVNMDERKVDFELVDD